jgi:hypothetical protein
MNSYLACNVCLSKSGFFARSRILHKYDVAYYRCEHCGFIQTEEPYWLGEAYTEVINDNDVGIVSRNLFASKITRVFASYLFNPKGKYLDYGGGCGLFVRLMRDSGFDFYWSDRFSENLLARGFEDDSRTKYEMVTAFEVFEHFAHPGEDIKNLLNWSHNLLFTTTLLPPQVPKPEDWYYYEIDHGQHISFYTAKTLALLANQHGLRFYTNHRYLHLITDKQISPLVINLLLRQKVIDLLSVFTLRNSFRDADYLKMTGKAPQYLKSEAEESK